MKSNKPLKEIIMLGPDPLSMGGISRVVKIWKDRNVFIENHIKYVSTSSDTLHSNIGYFVGAAIEAASKIARNCKFVYIHSSSYRDFYRNCFFILISLLFKKKIILHIHPNHFKKFLSELSGFKKIWTIHMLNQVEVFIVLTTEMKRTIKTYFPDKKVHILKNAVDLQSMQNTKNIQREKNQIVYLGWYIKEKGIYELALAVGQLRRKGLKVELDLYGTKERDTFKGYVEKINLSYCIRANGWINDEKKIDAMYRSTMLALPSYSEGIPNVILEAMATKTPIVSTLAGGLNEILRDGENAIVLKPKDVDDLCKKIDVCLKNSALRKKITDCAYEEAKREYDIPIIKEKLTKILNSIY